jgi:hypothetical protein
MVGVIASDVIAGQAVVEWEQNGGCRLGAEQRKQQENQVAGGW